MAIDITSPRGATPGSSPGALDAPSSYRWRLLGVLWLIVALVVALPAVGSGVVNTHMAKALELDRGIFGAAFGFFVLMMGLPAPLVAAGIRRFGVKPMIVLGCALLMLGTLLMATVVTKGWQFALIFGVLVGGGVATAGLLPAQAAVTHWFVDKRALAVSIVLSAIDIGGIAAAPLLEFVVASSGGDWRSGWWAMFALACLAMLAALTYIRNDGGITGSVGPVLPGPRSAGRVDKTAEEWTFREALRTRAFWFIAVFNCAVGMGWILLMAHGVIHLRDIGYSSGEAAQAVAILVTASLVGNMLAGVLGDRVPPQGIAAVATALLGVGLFAAVHPQGSSGVWAFAVPAGLGYGASQVCLMALLGNYYGPRAFPALFGLLLAGGTLLASGLAGGAGVAFDASGTYTPVLHACAVLLALAAVVVCLAGPPQRRAGG